MLNFFLILFEISGEKQNLRDMNSKLMDRLKHIWSSYKELNCKLQNVNSFEDRAGSAAKVDHDSTREEPDTTRYITLLKQQQQQKVCIKECENNTEYFLFSLFLFLYLSLPLFRSLVLFISLSLFFCLFPVNFKLFLQICVKERKYLHCNRTLNI